MINYLVPYYDKQSNLLNDAVVNIGRSLTIDVLALNLADRICFLSSRESYPKIVDAKSPEEGLSSYRDAVLGDYKEQNKSGIRILFYTHGYDFFVESKTERGNPKMFEFDLLARNKWGVHLDELDRFYNSISREPLTPYQNGSVISTELHNNGNPWQNNVGNGRVIIHKKRRKPSKD